MRKEDRNVALLSQQYALWDGSRGGSVEDAMAILHDDIHWCSLAADAPELDFAMDCRGKQEVSRYFTQLAADWEMIHFTVNDFIAQGDRVIMIGDCGFRSRKTGKIVESPKCDVWRFRDGKAVSFHEFFDTAKAAAVRPD